jgi:hypothetical protein
MPEVQPDTGAVRSKGGAQLQDAPARLSNGVHDVSAMAVQQLTRRRVD